MLFAKLKSQESNHCYCRCQETRAEEHLQIMQGFSCQPWLPLIPKTTQKLDNRVSVNDCLFNRFPCSSKPSTRSALLLSLHTRKRAGQTDEAFHPLILQAVNLKTKN